MPTGDAKAPGGPPVEPLIEQLGSKDFKIREKARKAILALGKEALPALRLGHSHADAEVRRALEELIPPLERALTLTPHLVTLHVNNKTVNEVVTELAKQSGLKILLGQNEGQMDMQNNQEIMMMQGGMVFVKSAGGMMAQAPPPAAPPPAADKGAKYSFHFDKVPFWEAFDKISERCGVVFQQGYTGDDTLHVLARSYVPYCCTSGPFKIVATGFSYNRSSNFAQVPRTPQQYGQQSYESLNLNLTIAVEPRLPILQLGQVKLTCAVDEENRSLLAPNDGNFYGPWGWQWRSNYGNWNRSVVHMTNANLCWPAKNCRTVQTLRGIIPVTVLAEQRPLLVTDKLMESKGKKIKVAQATFAIEDIVKLANKQQQIKVAITEENNTNDYSRIQTLQQRLELQDNKGNKLPCNCMITNWGGPNNAQFTLMAQPTNDRKLGPPSKLIYISWVTMEHEVPFEFHGLPLP